jgi:hypothetical protein
MGFIFMVNLSDISAIFVFSSFLKSVKQKDVPTYDVQFFSIQCFIPSVPLGLVKEFFAP